MTNPALRKVKVSVFPGGAGDPAQAEVDALDLSGDLAPIVATCMDEPANFRAMELARRLFDGRTRYAPMAVYVIAPDEIDVAKVGFASNPVIRLTSLQIGNWNRLTVRALLWVDAQAAVIEKLVHQAAKEMEIYLRGEWLAASPFDATELVLKAARHAKLPCYDSVTWMNNLGARSQALAEHRHYARRIAA